MHETKEQLLRRLDVKPMPIHPYHRDEKKDEGFQTAEQGRNEF